MSEDREIQTDEHREIFLRHPYIEIIDVLYGNIDELLRSKKSIESL